MTPTFLMAVFLLQVCVYIGDISCQWSQHQQPMWQNYQQWTDTPWSWGYVDEPPAMPWTQPPPPIRRQPPPRPTFVTTITNKPVMPPPPSTGKPPPRLMVVSPIKNKPVTPPAPSTRKPPPRPTLMRTVTNKPVTNPSPVTTTSKPQLRRPSNASDPCTPDETKMPDFRKKFSRVSQVKCHEYIWTITAREVKKDKEEKCRQKKGHKHRHVIKGRITTKGEYRHMGAIGWKARVGTWLFLCGGSLVSDKFVLTAAHCTSVSPAFDNVEDVRPKIVRLGDKNILGMSHGGQTLTDAKIKRIIAHPDYHSPMKYNDIALFELEEALKEFSNVVQPACLWSGDDTSFGKKASVTGWGAVETGSNSSELLWAEVDIVEHDVCAQLTRRWYNRNWNGLKNQICAGKLEGGADTCQGDSGGPLQVKIEVAPSVKIKMYNIIGVTSFGVGCGRKDSPGIYTQVSKYVGWIESIVWP